MSNIVPFNPAQVPAYIRNREGVSDLAKSLMGGGAGGKRISIKGGSFRLIVNGKEVAVMEERYLDVVIVAAQEKFTRQFFKGSFDEEKVEAPVCWSPDGDAPDKSVKSPQCDNCKQCPQNVSGSGQGDSKACRFSKRLAVLLANDMDGDVLQLSVPAASIWDDDDGENRALQSYARFLAAQNVDPNMVITRMKFDVKATAPKLRFKPVGWLDEELYALACEKGKTPEAKNAITMTVTQTDGVKEQAKPQKTEDDDPPPVVGKGGAKPELKVVSPAPTPAPAPAADEEPPPAAGRKKRGVTAPAEKVEEPQKREQAAAPAPGTKPSLAALAAQWDADDAR